MYTSENPEYSVLFFLNIQFNLRYSGSQSSASRCGKILLSNKNLDNIKYTKNTVQLNVTVSSTFVITKGDYSCINNNSI